MKKIWKSSGRDQYYASEGEVEEERLDRRPRVVNITGRSSCDQRENIKTVEVDTSQPYSYSTPIFQRSLHQSPSPITPSPYKMKFLQSHSASPRCHSASQTPKLGSVYYQRMWSSGSSGAGMPNYMEATESAKARVRSQSAPRQRASTPERDKAGSARKRLSFPDPDPMMGAIGLEGEAFGDKFEGSNMPSCCCTDIHEDETNVQTEQRSTLSSVMKNFRVKGQTTT